jgi:hypothetical protein
MDKTIPDPNFGRVLLEQKPNKGNIGNVIFLMILGLPMMLIVAAPGAPLEVRLGFLLFGGCLTGFASIMLWRNWMHVFLQETGIREYRQRHGRSLPYDQVDEVIYSSLRIFAHGSYIHTVQKLALRSEQTPGSPAVCTLIFKEADGRAAAEAKTALVGVRDQVSLRLAMQLNALVSRDGAIDWTPEARITARGLQLVDKQGHLEIVEWRRIGRDEIANGTLRLWLDGEDRPRLQIGTSKPNFYPIYFLLFQLRKQATG